MDFGLGCAVGTLKPLSLVHTCDISISINISIRICSVNRCDISISITKQQCLISVEI